MTRRVRSAPELIVSVALEQAPRIHLVAESAEDERRALLALQPSRVAAAVQDALERYLAEAA